MAQNTIYSGREFAVYVNEDNVAGSNGVGTFNSATDSTWKRLDVDSVTFPTFSPVTEFEMRSGSGRVAQFDQVYTSDKRVITEFSLSGRLTTQDLPIFAENTIGLASASDKIEVPSGYTPASPATGGTVVTGDYHLGLSFYFAAPGGASVADSYKLTGCVCTSLTLAADMDDAAGRFSFDATFQTAFAVAKGAVSTASMTGIGSTKLFLADLGYKTITLNGTTTLAANDALWKSVSCTIDSPVQFLGTTGTSGNPEVIARGVPETTFVLNGSVKYDTDTDQIIEAYRVGLAADYTGIYLATHAIATGTFNGSATGIGFNIPKGKFQSAEVSSDDVAMVNFECKALDGGSGLPFEILVA
tara:strand:- start:4202 stop:5275 length:1074 start_codon:yes stop_codon:yes gene_type:complete